jgi:hypothetical protein
MLKQAHNENNSIICLGDLNKHFLGNLPHNVNDILVINGLVNIINKPTHFDAIFICENLTKHRYEMLKRLNTHRINNKVHSYWTHDGSIIVKKSEHSGTKVVRNLEDVDRLALGSLN